MHIHNPASIPSPIPVSLYIVFFPFLPVSQVNRDLCLIQCSAQCREHWHWIGVKKNQEELQAAFIHHSFNAGLQV